MLDFQFCTYFLILHCSCELLFLSMVVELFWCDRDRVTQQSQVKNSERGIGGLVFVFRTAEHVAHCTDRAPCTIRRWRKLETSYLFGIFACGMHEHSINRVRNE